MATNSRKRDYEEFPDVSAVDHEAKRAKVHGVVASLSPMKVSASGKCNYFEGQLSDGKSKIRLFGFDTKQQQKLALFYEKKEAVALSNCEVTPSNRGPDLEVLVGRSTEMHKSPIKFDVSTLVCTPSNEITLNQLQGLQAYQRVNVKVKVVREGDTVEVMKGLKKQDVVVGDATGSAKLTLWENDIGLVEEGTSYKMTGMMVKVYNERKFLSKPKEDAEINIISDIGDVEEGESEEDDSALEDAVIIGVMSLDTLRRCFKCMGKVQTTSSGSAIAIGRCEKCGMVVRLDRCSEQMAAKVVVESMEVTKSLSVFSPIVEEICQGNVSEEALMTAVSFNLRFSPTNIITSINRN